MVGRRYFKAHGHGNDYLVIREGGDFLLDEALVKRVCDRTRGLGADGIVVVEKGVGTQAEPIQLRMFNPDGSEFERSGNGLRVAAAFLYEEQVVGTTPFWVSVGGDVVTMQVLSEAGGLLDVVVEMGKVSFPTGLPFVASGSSFVDGRIEVPVEGMDGRAQVVEGVAVSVGNPHVVLLADQWDQDALFWLGPQVTRHRIFPEGTNVQFASVGQLQGNSVPILIWERGVGRTTSSGTSSCAAAAAVIRQGLLGFGDVEIAMEGGTFSIHVAEDWSVTMRGPVEILFTAELSGVFEASDRPMP